MGRLGKQPSLMTQELAHGYLSVFDPPAHLLYKGAGDLQLMGSLFRQCSGHGGRGSERPSGVG